MGYRSQNIKSACEQGDLETIIYMHNHNDNYADEFFYYASVCLQRKTFAFFGLNTTKPYAHLIAWAVEANDFDTVKFILDNSNETIDFAPIFEWLAFWGIIIHNDNEWVLRKASMYGCTNLVKYLVEHGANNEEVQ